MSTSQLQRSFTRINGSDVYVSYASNNRVHSSEKEEKAPRVILLCGWMEAETSQLHKFTEMYNKIYPSATQILIRTGRKSLFVELSANKSYVLPAVKLLQDAGINAYDSPTSSGLLVHAISNGGAMSQTYLACCLADTRQVPPSSSTQHAALPAQALIYDSLPSNITFGVFTAFFKSPPPSTVFTLSPQSLSSYGPFTAYPNIIDGKLEDLTVLRANLNDPLLIPQHVPQTYLYSDVDKLTPAESVERHVEGTMDRLRKEGADADKLVRLEKFIGSPHVSHAKMNPRRYWAAVVQTWEASYRMGGTKNLVDGVPRLKL